MTAVNSSTTEQHGRVIVVANKKNQKPTQTTNISLYHSVVISFFGTFTWLSENV